MSSEGNPLPFLTRYTSASWLSEQTSFVNMALTILLRHGPTLKKWRCVSKKVNGRMATKSSGATYGREQPRNRLPATLLNGRLMKVEERLLRAMVRSA